MRILLICTSVLLAALLFVAGCGGNGDTGSTGMVKLLLADAPLHLNDGSVVSEVNVTITKVEVMGANESEVPRATLFEGSETVNLLTLANKPLSELLQLALTSVPAGAYEQLRFIVDEAASNVVVNGVTRPLMVASGPQTGLKIPLNLTVAPGTTQVVVLDFDLTKLHENAQFLLTPNAVRAVSMSEAGTVTGTAVLAEGVEINEDLPVTVTLYPAGSSEALATTQVVLTAATPSATFVINGVPVGSYIVRATAPEGTGTFTVETAEFTVSAGQTVDLDALAIGTPPAPEPDPEPEP